MIITKSLLSINNTSGEARVWQIMSSSNYFKLFNDWLKVVKNINLMSACWQHFLSFLTYTRRTSYPCSYTDTLTLLSPGVSSTDTLTLLGMCVPILTPWYLPCCLLPRHPLLGCLVPRTIIRNMLIHFYIKPGMQVAMKLRVRGT